MIFLKKYFCKCYLKKNSRGQKHAKLHMALSRLVSLTISSHRNLDIEANKFYDRANRFYDAARIT